ATGSTALAARWAARPFTPSQILSPAAQKEGIMAGALGRKSGSVGTVLLPTICLIDEDLWCVAPSG
ncbi:hypothetical protein, partial [Aquaspirillum soli]